MGQYYNIITRANRKDGKYTVYDRSTKEYKNDKPEYMMAKLTEHGWLYNFTTDAISAKIFQRPTRVAWIGDYVDQMDEYDITNKDLDYDTVMALYNIAWVDEKTKYHSLIRTKFGYHDALLVNHSKKLYVKMDRYMEVSTFKSWGYEWCAHPLTMLTALGNGFGGGDYHGVNEDKVGIWAFDVISFEDGQDEGVFTNRGYKEFEIRFNETERNEEVE